MSDSGVDELGPLSGLDPSIARAGGGDTIGGGTIASNAAQLRGQLAVREARVRRRRRLIASGTAVGMLAASAAVWFGTDPTRLAVFAPAAAPAAQPAVDTWESRAQVALAGLSSQLKAIDETTQAWDTRIAPRWGATTPSPMRALMDHRALLEQQRTVLVAQLANPAQLQQAERDLAELGVQAAALQRALAAANPDSAPRQPSTLSALRAALGLARQQQLAKQGEVTRLTEGVRTAEATPLPAGDLTTPLTRAVLALGTGAPAEPAPRPAPDQLPASLAAGPDGGRRVADQVTTGEPVAPRGEPSAPRQPGSAAAGGPAGKGPQGGALAGGGADGAVRAVAGTADAAGQAVNTAVDTVGGAAQGLLNTGAPEHVEPKPEPRPEPQPEPKPAPKQAPAPKPRAQAPAKPAPAFTPPPELIAPAVDSSPSGTDAPSPQAATPRSSSGQSSPTGTGQTAGSSGSAPRSSSGGFGGGSSQAQQLEQAQQIVRGTPGGAMANGPIEVAKKMQGSPGGATSTRSSGLGGLPW